MSRIGAAPRGAVATSDARAPASRANGAKSRGPKTPAGKARSALNALKHGMRAAMPVVLPDEDAVAFAALQTALFAELAPEGALQLVLARRVAVAAWRLARADRRRVSCSRSVAGTPATRSASPLIRDGNGTRSIETLMRYCNVAVAEFTRALRTLKALQAEQATEHATGATVTDVPRRQPRAPAPVASRPAPDEPEARSIDQSVPQPPGSGRTLHERAACWMPDEPERARTRNEAPVAGPPPESPGGRTNPRCRTNPWPSRDPAAPAAITRSPACAVPLRSARRRKASGTDPSRAASRCS